MAALLFCLQKFPDSDVGRATSLNEKRHSYLKLLFPARGRTITALTLYYKLFPYNDSLIDLTFDTVYPELLTVSSNKPRVINQHLTFKRTYERWELKDGEGKLRINTSGDE
jgi:hypothetical protein